MRPPEMWSGNDPTNNPPRIPGKISPPLPEPLDSISQSRYDVTASSAKEDI